MRANRRFPVLIAAIAFLVMLLPPTGKAAQSDITGPAGSVAFGTFVAALPNGNIVVVDPVGPVASVGAVYLYGPGRNLISSLTGSTVSDRVGSGGIVIVGDSNFVVLSPDWDNGAATAAGAVTWVDGSLGLSGVVSPSNSLVGTTANDQIGVNPNGPVTVLSNGNYVVASPNWYGQRGAATWGSGTSAITGNVSAANSLVGTAINDKVGYDGVTALSNGNYVVKSTPWNGTRGAATWGNGSSGISGIATSINSLVGSSANDYIGASVTALTNGNYVAASGNWNGYRGAATWASGTAGMTGTVTAGNSLIGTLANDQIGSHGVTPLTNGSFVVKSPDWNDSRGAATWGSGTAALSGVVAASNSVVGSAVDDQVGFGATALTNGAAVIVSPNWNSGRGAVTWLNGTSSVGRYVTGTNSLSGASAGDQVGSGGAYALSTNNYVVLSPNWNGTLGAATWCDGATGLVGSVSATNSLVGTLANDLVGIRTAVLSNGNFVIGSPNWHGRGAVTWGNGALGLVGSVSQANSLVGSAANDKVGNQIAALANGNYVVGSPNWFGNQGAATWASGATGITGEISGANSLVGMLAGDFVGTTVSAQADGNYVVQTPNWNGKLGAVTLASGAFRLAGTIEPWNSVIGAANNGGGLIMVFSYSVAQHRLAVGRPAENIVSLFTLDQVFASSFE